MTHTKEVVINLIQGMGFEDINISDDQSLKNDVGFDSLDKVDLVIRCEREFGIRFFDEDHEAIKTIGDIVSYIEDKVKLNEAKNGIEN